MKKNGFTLVELIAVIVILSIVLTLSVPSLIGALKNNKEKSLEKINELIILAAKDYVVDYGLEIPRKIAQNELCKNYLDCPIINPVTKEEMVFSVGVDENKNYTILNNQLIELKVVLNGGILSKDISGGYEAGSTITLPTPTKNNASFEGWEVISGDASINGSILTIGTNKSILVAKWYGLPVELNVDLDGGTSDKIFNKIYYAGQTLDLGIPTKNNYIFTGWKIISGDSIISGNNITFGTNNVSVKANWKAVVITYDLLVSSYKCANNQVGTSYIFEYTGNCEVINDENDNWRIKFLTSGNLMFKFEGLISIDAFVVGGGGAGRKSEYAGGGAGGYTNTYKKIQLQNNTNHTVQIGAGGTTSSANGTASYFMNNSYSANGSAGGQFKASSSGGSNGGNFEQAGFSYGATGQGKTTCEFDEGTTSSCTKGTLFAYAGGGGGNGNASAKGGIGGGGDGSDVKGKINGGANTGGGGGGGWSEFGAGGSGIVVIRNAR